MTKPKKLEEWANPADFYKQSRYDRAASLISEDKRDRSWVHQGSCVGLPTQSFFPEGYRSADEELVQMCKKCPVRVECLAYGIQEPYAVGGTWGGMSGWRLRQARAFVLNEGFQPAEAILKVDSIETQQDREIKPGRPRHRYSEKAQYRVGHQ